ncbi:MAG: hypothetical protein ACYC5W_02960 [Thauera sp.]
MNKTRTGEPGAYQRAFELQKAFHLIGAGHLSTDFEALFTSLSFKSIENQKNKALRTTGRHRTCRWLRTGGKMPT